MADFYCIIINLSIVYKRLLLFMWLIKARVRGYRSIIDSGYFDVDKLKTILIGSNEAGKTVLLNALHKLNPKDETLSFDLLRDYPRARYDKNIVHKAIDISSFTAV
jgi:predicted ATP-dependent endonuclease of OLD family